MQMDKRTLFIIVIVTFVVSYISFFGLPKKSYNIFRLQEQVEDQETMSTPIKSYKR